MKTRKIRKLPLLIAVVMLVLAFSTTGFASYVTKTIQANYRNVTVFVNGAQKNLKSEPFIVDGTTYVPLRDVAEIMGSTVAFNPATYRIDITNMGDAGLQYDLYIKDARIKELEAKLNEKEKEEDKVMSIRDLEKQLEDDYEEIGDVDIKEIDLDGDEDDIEVEIYIDTTKSSQNEAWSDLDDKDIERFLQKIVNDILDEYEDADITGFIEDERDDYELESFSIDRDDDVKLD
jgi:hypothetical protein